MHERSREAKARQVCLNFTAPFIAAGMLGTDWMTHDEPGE